MKATKEEVAQALAQLKKAFPPGSRIFIRQDHRSASGMYRVYNVYGIGKDSDGKPDLFRYSWHVAAVCGFRYDSRHEGIGIDGCGFSGSHEIMSTLSYKLHGNESRGPTAKDAQSRGIPFDQPTRKEYRAGYSLKLRDL